MKNFKLLFLFVVFLTTSFSSFSQNREKYLEYKAYVQKHGYTIVSEYQLNLKESSSFYCTKTFCSGINYILIAFSEDNDVEDVDVYLKEMDGTEYIKDTDESNVAVVEFNPLTTREMKMFVKNYKSRTPLYESKCWLLIAFKNN